VSATPIPGFHHLPSLLAECLAGGNECQFLSHWFDPTCFILKRYIKCSKKSEFSKVLLKGKEVCPKDYSPKLLVIVVERNIVCGGGWFEA